MKADPNLLKRLRAERAQYVAAAAAKAREQAAAVRAVKKALGKGPATVPEVAEATGMGTASVLWYLAALKKYGEVVEAGKQGDYFAYGLCAPAALEKAEAAGEKAEEQEEATA
ncbi:hypothetical protein dsx2_2962 [Desulfovibrio sp. X2]|uniref:hypothetical protein n=1 Tax=Desulfovibrio sp. X2 TaxID=941449 RepID=UPI000358DFEE|nr:hypothetical protein [Desulfovibrio sp. X2]EPR41958.1 hypothetical protein dsx2_2962 [Desulfovibrio sp. X2]